MTFLAHHMAVELLGREFSPHGLFQHVCTFGAIGALLATSAYGSWTLFRKAREAVGARQRV